MQEIQCYLWSTMDLNTTFGSTHQRSELESAPLTDLDTASILLTAA